MNDSNSQDSDGWHGQHDRHDWPYENPRYGVRTSAAAIVSLLFGFAAWTVLPVAGAIVAVVCGHMARATIRRSAGLVDGDALALGGLVLGWLQLLLIGAAILLLLGVFGHVINFDHSWWPPLQPQHHHLPPGGQWV